MQWVRLGDHDRRTRAGRAVMAALRAGSEAYATAVAQRFVLEALPIRPGRGPGLTPLAARPWRDSAASPSLKRRKADQPKGTAPAVKARHGPPRRPGWVVVDANELDALTALLHGSGPEVRRMFAACVGADDQLQFLTALRDFQQDPDDAPARDCWMGWAQRIRQA